jgi:hypothetical protein
VDHGGGLYTGAVDTYLEAAAPTSQHGADPILWMDGTQNNETRHGLLRFDNLFGTGPGQIPPDAYILSARLYLTTPYTQAQAAGGGASPHLPFQPWTDTATWANDFGGDGIQADDYDAFSYAEPNTGVVGLGTHGFDVTISVLFWEWGVPNYGLALLPNTNDGWAISSAEYEVAVERPRLVVVWWPFTGPGPGGSPGTIGSITDVSPLLGGEVDSLRQQVESYTPRGVAVGVRQEHPATREEVRAPSLLIEDTFADVPWAALARLSATRGQGKHGAAWTATHDLPFMIDPTQRAQAV